jgi:hypothetical protein
MTTLILIILAFGAGVAAASAWFRGRLREQATDVEELERAVVRAAFQHGGRITALDVRAPRGFVLAEVESELRRLHTAGYCESDLTPDGHPVYVFPEFDEQPQRALRLVALILQLARTGRGLLDVSKVAAETELSYLEARRLLDSMSEQGICQPTGDPDTYRFFASRDSSTVERNRAGRLE